AGVATLKIVSEPAFFETLGKLTGDCMQGLTQAAREAGIERFCADSVGGMFGIYFSHECPKSLDDVTNSNREAFNRFFHAMLERGVYLAPSAYEAGFLSIEHLGDPIDIILKTAREAFKEIASVANA
ncbi:MAG: aspartate aminotransferase family protein, partial [Burkholderiaceae bacterium]